MSNGNARPAGWSWTLALLFVAICGALCCGSGAERGKGARDQAVPPATVRSLTEQERLAYRRLQKEGRDYFRQSRPDEAVKSLTEARDLNPGEAEIYNDLGVVYRNKKEYGKALDILAKGIKIDPYFPMLHMNLGLVYEETGEFEPAVKELTQVTRLLPSFGDAYCSLGGVYVKIRKYDEALEQYKRAIDLNPKDRKAHLGMGETFFIQGKYQEALGPFQRAQELNPVLPDAYYKLGQICLRLGQEALAQDYLRKFEQFSKHQGDTEAMELLLTLGSADAEEVLFRLALKYGEQGKWPEAIERWERLVALNPGHADAHYFLSIALSRVGDAEKALAECGKAIDLRPEDDRYYYQLGFVKAGLGRVDDATAAMQRAYELSPDNPQILLSLSNLLRESGQYDRALAALQRLVALDPASLGAHEGLLEVYCWAKDPAFLDPRKALAEAAVALRLGSKDYASLAKAYELNEQIDEATRILREGMDSLERQGAPAQQIAELRRQLASLNEPGKAR